MKLIGVTGGVGAGKSEILSFLEKNYQAKTVGLDDVARTLQEKGGACYEGMIALCGKDIVKEDGSLDRPAIAAKMYTDKELIKKINALVHPAVRLELKKIIEEKRKMGCPLLVVEAALLIEEGYDEICDELWYIYADENVRRSRLKAARHYSEEKITSILKSQLSDKEFRAHATVVIDNSGSFEETAGQIKKIVK